VVRAVNGTCYTDSTGVAGTDAAGTPPGETAPGSSSSTAQTWSSKTAFTWPPVTGATSYTVYRGTLEDLPNVLSSDPDSCTLYTGPLTYATDTANPLYVPGELYWYIVIATNAYGDGPAGNATAGPRIMNSTGTCP